jgi:lipopolysaccharide transport system permease protein
MIIFFHNLLGLLFALIAIKGSISIHWLSLLLSVTLGSIFLWGFGTALAIASARFRDVPLAVQSLLTILFFLTPIIWSVDQVSSTDLIGLIYLNPFAVFLDLSRLPFNLSLDPINFKAYAISLISLTVGTFMLHKFSSKICYWL